MRVTRNINQQEALKGAVFSMLPKELQDEMKKFDSKLAAVYFNLNGTVSVVIEDGTAYGA